MTLRIDKDVPNGTVLMLGISYRNDEQAALTAGPSDANRGMSQPKVFTYVGLKAGGLWYFTGTGKTPQAASWPAVERWLARDNRKLEWVNQASRWTHLWPLQTTGAGAEGAKQIEAPCPAGPSCYALDEPVPTAKIDPGQPPACPDHAEEGNQLSCAWCGEERAAFYRRLAEAVDDPRDDDSPGL
jgi:hypothetical protein